MLRLRVGYDVKLRLNYQFAYDGSIILFLWIFKMQIKLRSEIMTQLISQYGDDSPLFLANDTSVGYACTGAKPGDLLGIFFSVTGCNQLSRKFIKDLRCE